MSFTLEAFTRQPGNDSPTLPDPTPKFTSLVLESPINRMLRLNCRVRPFFKPYRALPLSETAQLAESEDIWRFEIGQTLTNDLGA